MNKTQQYSNIIFTLFELQIATSNIRKGMVITQQYNNNNYITTKAIK